MIKVNQQYFELIEDYRECFDEELFAQDIQIYLINMIL